MAINERVHRLDSYKFYPRPNHFKKRLDSLMPRFASLVDAFGGEFQDVKWRTNINETYQWLSRSLVITTMGTDKFGRTRFVIHDADEWADFPEAEMVLTSDMAGLCVTVCYIKVEDTAEKGKKIVQRVIESLSHFLNSYSADKPKSGDTHPSDGQHLSDDEDHFSSIQHNDDQDLFKSLFIFCEIVGETSDGEIASFRNYINDCVREQSDTWPGEKRIVMGPDQVTLGSLISEHVEGTIMQVFWFIYEYLGRFTCGRQPQTDGKDIALSDEVQTELYAFVRSDIDLADMQRQMIDAHLKNPEDTRTEDTQFLDYLVDHLITRLKCVVLGLLALKTGLNNQICGLCLNVIRFDKIVKKHLSINTKEYLKRLRPFSENFDEIIIKKTEEMKTGKRRKTCTDNDYIVTFLTNDLSAALSEVLRELTKAVRHISTIEKRRYEIEGYFRIAGTPVGPPSVKTPPELLKDLTRIQGVVGAGTIYSKLEVHIKENEEQSPTKLEIEDVIRRHKYSKPYQVRQVLKEASPLHKVQQGHLIKSKKRGSEGTLGIFAEAEGTIHKSGQESKAQLYALTCAHVVNPVGDGDSELPVLVDDGAQKENQKVDNVHRWRKFGVCKPQLTVISGTVDGAKLVDIAAVQVNEDQQSECMRPVKNEDGIPKPAFVKNCSFEDLEKQVVYKFGATTGFTQGLVCSNAYLTKLNTEMCADYIVVIDKLPGKNRDIATSGDSGSIACMPAVNDEDLSSNLTKSGDSGSIACMPTYNDKDKNCEFSKSRDRGTTPSVSTIDDEDQRSNSTTSGDTGSTASMSTIDDEVQNSNLTNSGNAESIASMSTIDEKDTRGDLTKKHDSGYMTNMSDEDDLPQSEESEYTGIMCKPKFDDQDQGTAAATYHVFAKQEDSGPMIDGEAATDRGSAKPGDDDAMIDGEAVKDRGSAKPGDDDAMIDGKAVTDRGSAKPGDDDAMIDGEAATDRGSAKLGDDDAMIDGEDATDRGSAKPGDDDAMIDGEAVTDRGSAKPRDSEVTIKDKTVTYRVFAKPDAIDDEAAAVDLGFAKPGDSGSIVCMPAINVEGQSHDSIALVAMVNAGELQLRGFDSTLTLAFSLDKGIETLNKKSRLQMRTCTLDFIDVDSL